MKIYGIFMSIMCIITYAANDFKVDNPTLFFLVVASTCYLSVKMDEIKDEIKNEIGRALSRG